MRTSSRRWFAVLAIAALLGQGVVGALAAPAVMRGASAARHPVPGAVKPAPAAPDDSVPASPGDSAAFRPAAVDSLADYRAAFYDTTMGDSVRESRLYLAWGAPCGMPRARANVNFTCSDTNEVDTLYLSFETGRDLPRFYGMIGYLNILPAAGDSLGAFWDYSSEGGNRGGLKIQADPDGTFPCSQPFLRQGMAVPYCEFRPSKERIFFGYAVKLQDPGPVMADTRYCFARLLFAQKRCRLPGASQPVCIEWEKAEYSPGGKPLFITRGPERFASVNSPEGSVCAPHRAFGKPPVWLPRPASPAAPPDSTRR
jgi:hypothetical protein